MPTLELSPTVFSILSALIEEKVGLHYGLDNRDLLQDKASLRAQDVGFDSLLDYYYYLRYDPRGDEELSELAETLIVGETYFFREWVAIEALVKNFIEPWCSAGRKPRIWSAACSTGEEPLSLAMLLDERQLLDKVEIVASDLSTRALQRARLGRFGRRSVRQVPAPQLLDRYLQREDDGYRIKPHLIDSIHWERRNLLDPAEFAQIGKFDAILCRNVLIYFSDKTVRSVLDRFTHCLVPDGVLLVGISESLLRFGSGFVGEEKGGAFVYRKVQQT